MHKFTLLIFSCLFALHVFCKSENDSIQARKLDYNDFIANYSINDTSAVIIDIFFDKKEVSAYGEMSFLPITLALFIVSPELSIATTVVSLPLFIHGAYTLFRYRKKRLLQLLIDYKTTGFLPKRIRKKAIHRIQLYNEFDEEYN